MSESMDDSIEIGESKMRNDGSATSNLRKSVKCAKQIIITLNCELNGYDIKTLNAATGKGSYMLKVGTKDFTVVHQNSKSNKEEERKVSLTLYKFKGLRGFLRRAAENRLLKLRSEGKVVDGPCAPNKNFPNEDILKQYEALGYHAQGSCSLNKCFVRRLYGSLEETASVNIFPPYIAKASVENLPADVTNYLEENIESIFNLPQCVVYQNGSSALKTETFNIINRATDQAVNNFMKHSANGTFKFKIVFKGSSENLQELLENIGFFITSLFEISKDNGLQIGADKTNGSGRVTIDIIRILANHKFPIIEEFIEKEIERVHAVKFGTLELKEIETTYQLDLKFAAHCKTIFDAIISSNPLSISESVKTEA